MSRPKRSRKRLKNYVSVYWMKPASRLKVDLRRVLLLPPDLTRAHSGAGWIPRHYSNYLKPATPTSSPPSASTSPTIAPPHGCSLDSARANSRHDWRTASHRGLDSAEVVKEKFGEFPVDWEIPITSIPSHEAKVGPDHQRRHVVPTKSSDSPSHKNIFIGLAGKDTICAAISPPPPTALKKTRPPRDPASCLLQLGRKKNPRHLKDVYLQVTMPATPREAGALGIFVA